MHKGKPGSRGPGSGARHGNSGVSWDPSSQKDLNVAAGIVIYGLNEAGGTGKSVVTKPNGCAF